MKIILTSAMALGALCILETNQAAIAALIDSPHFHFVRGGRGAVGGHGFENHGEGERAAEGRGDEGRGNEGRGNENRATNSDAGAADRSTTAEDRVHRLDNTGNDLRNDEGLGADGGWVGVTGACPNGATRDASGYCPN